MVTTIQPDEAAVLPQKLQELADRLEISELIATYGQIADQKRFEDSRSCCTENVLADFGFGRAHGVDTLIGYGRQALGVFERTQHFISNVLIEVAGDSARSEHYVLALTRVKADGVVSDSLVATRIVDDLVRHEGRWAIARRRLRFDWAHDIGPRPDAWLYGTLDPATLLHSAKFPGDIVYDA